MEGKDLLSVADLGTHDIKNIIDAAMHFKKNSPGSLLRDASVALVFEKPSLRTRVSFEVAMTQLGGRAVYLSPVEVGLGRRELVQDVARVLSRYVNGVVARTFSHRTVRLFAEFADVPVINGLDDEEHPCQILADLLTIRETKGDLKGLTLAFIGDGNNVSNSLLLGASLVGMNFRIASPPGYEIHGKFVEMARRFGSTTGADIVCTSETAVAAKDADVLYTDVWTSMGQESESAQRRAAFAGYQVDKQLLSLARPDAIFMHPLPAHRGEEVAADIIEGPQSVVFLQAENRLHVQKAILVHLLKKN
ncbi:MAG: ornithine carbamoyltransferase [Chloroflexi bacterium]|nr:ornithine carbamoyltransferase [Chloroflexota bacterium]